MYLDCIASFQSTYLLEVFEDGAVRHETPAETAQELPAPQHRERVQVDPTRLLDQLAVDLTTQVLHVIAGVDDSLGYRDGVAQYLVVQQGAEHVDSFCVQRLVLPPLGGQEDRLPVGEGEKWELDGGALVTQNP